MSFFTNADIINGKYGRWKPANSKNKQAEFIPLGKAITVENVTRNIETNEVHLILAHEYLGEKINARIPRKDLADHTLLQDLAKTGADIAKKDFDVLVDTLRIQEHLMEANGYGAERVYSHLGWKSMPKLDMDGNVIGSKLCYRAATMIGEYSARYDGTLVVEPKGSFEGWRDMVLKEVLGHPPLEFALVAALAAPINGLIATSTTGENPLVHIHGLSGTGKTTAAILGSSTSGEPFDGERTVSDRYGILTRKRSVYGSWSGTENGILGQCSGNRGAVIVLNELGKFRGKDLTSLIYNFSEGTDKIRLSKDMVPYQLEGYTTVFISVGEFSILEVCKSKADGLRSRVMEIEGALTASADHADRIKAACRRHNGWAAPMMAEYIIYNMGMKKVLEVYNLYCGALKARWPETPGKERFVSKFAALFLTAADIAEPALGIKFNMQAILDFILAHESTNGEKRESAISAYDTIIGECRVNRSNFYRSDNPAPVRECWGKICEVHRELDDGRVVMEEFLVRKPVVNSILKKHGFENSATCAKRWSELGLTSCDKDRPTRSRKIEPESSKYEEVFVFRVFEEFADLVDGVEHESDILPKEESKTPKPEATAEPEVYELPKSLIQMAAEEEVASYGKCTAEDAHTA